MLILLEWINSYDPTWGLFGFFQVSWVWHLWRTWLKEAKSQGFEVVWSELVSEASVSIRDGSGSQQLLILGFRWFPVMKFTCRLSHILL